MIYIYNGRAYGRLLVDTTVNAVERLDDVRLGESPNQLSNNLCTMQ